jgi:hypothetical protein
MSTENQNASTDPGRTYTGKFATGNPGGPGNPLARQTAARRQAWLNSVTPQDIQDVAAKLTALAKEGNVQAAKLLLSYAIGKPQPAPQPDRMDVDEWDVYRQTTPMKKEAAAVMEAGLPASHLKYVRMFRPVISEMVNDQLVAMFNEDPKARQEREDREAAEMEEYLKTPVSDVPELQAYLESLGESPSANGSNGEAPPLANGKNGAHAPSANGKNGAHAPSANGKVPPPELVGTRPM